MKRKFIATILVFLSISFNAYAESFSTIKPVVNTINYSSINHLIIERNTTVKTNQNIIDKLFINYNNLSIAESDIEDAIKGMKALLVTYKAQPSTPTTPVVSQDISLEDPVIIDIYSNINIIMSSLQAMNTMNIKNLQSNISSMEDQLENINNQQSDMDSLINKMKVQTEMINNQMVWTGENLLFAYNAIEIQEKNIDKNLALLESRLKVLNIQKDLGYINAMDKDTLEISIEDLNYAKETLKLQKENIRRQINLLLGQSYDTSLNIVFTPTIYNYKLNSMNNLGDLRYALGNSYSIIIQEYEVQSKQVALSRAENDHGNGSNQYKLAAEELDDVQLNFEDIKRAQNLKFQQTYEAVKDKQKIMSLEEKKLAQEKTKLEAANKKYDLGMISKVEYDNVKSSYDLQGIKVETAKGDLFTAYRKYEWMLKGLSL